MKKTHSKLRTLLIVLSMMAVLSPVAGGYLYYSSLKKSSLEVEHKAAEEHVKGFGHAVDTHLEWGLISSFHPTRKTSCQHGEQPDAISLF